MPRRYLTAAFAGLLLISPAMALADLTPCDAAFGELVQRSAQMPECELNRFMYENIPSVLGRCTLEERQVLEESREGFAEDMQRQCPAPVPAQETPAAPTPPAKKMPDFPPGLESL